MLGIGFLPSMDEQDSFCKAGDLIIIDEVWRIWGNDKDIPKIIVHLLLNIDILQIL